MTPLMRTGRAQSRRNRNASLKREVTELRNKVENLNTIQTGQSTKINSLEEEVKYLKTTQMNQSARIQFLDDANVSLNQQVTKLHIFPQFQGTRIILYY